MAEYLAMFLGHDTWDLIRDTVSGIVAGLILLALSGYLAHRRSENKRITQNQTRLDRHAVEIRHTQKATKVDPFYSDDL